MEGGVQRPGIRDSPAPTPWPAGPREEPDQGQGLALTPHPWRLGQGGHRGRTLPLHGLSCPRARPGEEAHGKVGAGVGRCVPRAGIVGSQARAWTPGWRGQCGAGSCSRGSSRSQAEWAAAPGGGRTQEEAVSASPVTLGPFRVSGADCASSLRGSSQQRGPLSPTGPSAQSGHCPAARRAVYAPVPAPRRIQPRSSGHPTQCDAVFHVPAAAGSGPMNACFCLRSYFIYIF